MREFQQKTSLGIILVLLSGLFYGTNPTLSKIHFQNGGDTLSFLIARFLIATLLLFALWLWKKPATRPSFKQSIIAMGLGLIVFGISFVYIAAIQFIPAGLATLLLFTFPLWIGVLSFVTKEEPLDAIKIGCLVLAFLGLILTIGTEFKSLDWRGILLGLLAAFGLALNVFYGNRSTKHMDGLNLTLLMMFASALACLPTLLFDQPNFPITILGWLNLIISAIFFSGGIFCFFVGLPHLGPIKASLYNNIEPVFSIFLAYLLLSEKLTLLQYVGSAIVITAIFAIQLLGPKKANNNEQ